MVNYGNSPSLLRVLSTRVSASLYARPTDDSPARALRARSGNRGNTPSRGHAKTSVVRPASLARDLSLTLLHGVPFRAGIGLACDRAEHGPACIQPPSRRQTARVSASARIRQRSSRRAQTPSAGGMAKLRSCSLSYFISHSLLRGPGSRVATGPRSALLGVRGNGNTGSA